MTNNPSFKFKIQISRLKLYISNSQQNCTATLKTVYCTKHKLLCNQNNELHKKLDSSLVLDPAYSIKIFSFGDQSYLIN